MPIARITELSATSNQSFDDAVAQGIARATKTLRGVTGAWVKEQQVSIENGQVQHYQVNLQITFILEDSDSVS